MSTQAGGAGAPNPGAAPEDLAASHPAGTVEATVATRGEHHALAACAGQPCLGLGPEEHP